MCIKNIKLQSLRGFHYFRKIFSILLWKVDPANWNFRQSATKVYCGQEKRIFIPITLRRFTFHINKIAYEDEIYTYDVFSAHSHKLTRR